MNPVTQLMRLRQGNQPIERYVVDFIELAHLSSLDEVCLMIFFPWRAFRAAQLPYVTTWLWLDSWTLYWYCIANVWFPFHCGSGLYHTLSHFFGSLLRRLRLGFRLCIGSLLRRFRLGSLIRRLCLSPLFLSFLMDLALHPSPCSASAPPPSWILHLVCSC